MREAELLSLPVAAEALKIVDGECLEMRFPVVGLSHDGRDQIVRDNATMGSVVFLKREPENLYDRNAVKVCLGGDMCIGYLARQVAALMARDMDGGTRYTAYIEDIDAEIDYRLPEVWIKVTKEG